MRGIVAFVILSAAWLILPVSAVAAPNEFRVVSGTLLHPATLGAGVTVAVLKSDDGSVYYADLRAVSDIPTLQRGAMVTLVGFEGARPDQLVIRVIHPTDMAPADTLSERVGPADTLSERSQRISGRIGSLTGPTVLVQAADGNEATLLLRGIKATILKLLRLGDWVTVFGQPEDSDFLVTGIIQSQD